MRDPENIQGLIELKPDFIGFIFYPKSDRFVAELNHTTLKSVPDSIKKVGVFVNEAIEKIIETAKIYQLDFVQLHGSEDPKYTKELKDLGLKIIKVFRITDVLPTNIDDFKDVVDYLLFDTETKYFGGSGKQFDWNILKTSNISVPFLLSGGIKLDDIKKIKSLDIPALEGIDVNSKFELEPGLKDLQLLSQLKEEL